MLSSATLRKTGSGWEFANEEALEDFVETHLESLLGLTVIKRQFTVNEQRCDIVAVDENKRLVVLELKNGEDRYLVQQLTRYYDALLEHKPFADRVDYDQPVRLIAITPKFHRDNFTDRKYHQLFFNFFQLAVIQNQDKFYLHFKDIDTQETSQIDIPYREIDYRKSDDIIPPPPRLILDWLGSWSAEDEDNFQIIREQILRFDNRMQEIIELKSIKYGIKKTKPCAELYFQRKSKEIILFLWLPIPNRKKQAIARMQVHTDWDVYWQFSHVPEGLYKDNKHKSYLKIRKYENEPNVRIITAEDWICEDLDKLVAKALNTWQNRL
jgi:RecB family endonuclease NucS